MLKTTLKNAAIRVTESLPFSWNLAVRKRYAAYVLANDPDPADTTILTALMQPDSIVVDAGANVGAYTKVLATHAPPHTTVLSVEPIPQTRALLTHNVHALGLSNVEIIACALSDRNGSVIMEIPEANHSPVLALARIKYSADTTAPLATHVTVQTRTLDDLLSDESRPVSLLKGDVEMHELEMLIGANGTIHRNHPAIYLELQPDFPSKPSQRGAVTALLDGHGYQAFAFERGYLHPWATDSNALDVFFLTADHLARLHQFTL